MLTLEEAARYIGLSPEDLLLSRQRGLPPGNLGIAVSGEVFFLESDVDGGREEEHFDLWESSYFDVSGEEE